MRDRLSASNLGLSLDSIPSSEFIDVRDLAEDLNLINAVYCEEPLDPSVLEYRREMYALLEASGNSDLWEWGNNEPTLIPESEFVEYAKQLHDDINGNGEMRGWPYTCIDWDKAADELKQDYTTVEFEGRTLYYRAF